MTNVTIKDGVVEERDVFYKEGDWFYIEGDLCQLCMVDSGFRYCLIMIFCGNRYANPIKIEDPDAIDIDQIKIIAGYGDSDIDIIPINNISIIVG